MRVHSSFLSFNICGSLSDSEKQAPIILYISIYLIDSLFANNLAQLKSSQLFPKWRYSSPHSSFHTLHWTTPMQEHPLYHSRSLFSVLASAPPCCPHAIHTLLTLLVLLLPILDHSLQGRPHHLAIAFISCSGPP